MNADQLSQSIKQLKIFAEICGQIKIQPDWTYLILGPSNEDYGFDSDYILRLCNGSLSPNSYSEFDVIVGLKSIQICRRAGTPQVNIEKRFRNSYRAIAFLNKTLKAIELSSIIEK